MLPCATDIFVIMGDIVYEPGWRVTVLCLDITDDGESVSSTHPKVNRTLE